MTSMSYTGWPTIKKPIGKVSKPRRKKCAFKEKQRNDQINQAFQRLQEKTMISLSPNVKVPKIKILKVAKMLITYLVEKLNQPDDQFDPCCDDIAALIMQEMISKNTYTTRAAEEMSACPPLISQDQFETHDSPSSSSPSPQGIDTGYISTSNEAANSSFSCKNSPDVNTSTPTVIPTLTPSLDFINPCKDYYRGLPALFTRPINAMFCLSDSESP